MSSTSAAAFFVFHIPCNGHLFWSPFSLIWCHKVYSSYRNCSWNYAACYLWWWFCCALHWSGFYACEVSFHFLIPIVHFCNWRLEPFPGLGAYKSVCHVACCPIYGLSMYSPLPLLLPLPLHLVTWSPDDVPPLLRYCIFDTWYSMKGTLMRRFVSSSVCVIILCSASRIMLLIHLILALYHLWFTVLFSQSWWVSSARCFSCILFPWHRWCPHNLDCTIHDRCLPIPSGLVVLTVGLGLLYCFRIGIINSTFGSFSNTNLLHTPVFVSNFFTHPLKLLFASGFLCQSFQILPVYMDLLVCLSSSPRCCHCL